MAISTQDFDATAHAADLEVPEGRAKTLSFHSPHGDGKIYTIIVH